MPISTVRKLIRMIYTMLKERKEWKYENTALTESELSRLVMTESGHSGQWRLSHGLLGRE